ncbi:BPSS1187 family protein [Dyella sp. A6]|uniref:BPSS1187 family protein n=1 Tax=Dyella aluminiiresistens TaxID=3069105 RepID=UPI002E75A9EB|nr:hypothetical protein [Dyella sp. A6]
MNMTLRHLIRRVEKVWPHGAAARIPAIILLLASSSTAQSASPASSQPLVEHEISVSVVDPAAHQPPNKITGNVDSNISVVTDAPGQRKGRLFLFIDGTGTSPEMTKDIVLFAAGRGYNAVSIAYPNNTAIAQICKTSPDPDCTGKVREEMLTGRDTSPLISVAKADAIEPRLKGLLNYLHRRYPTEGWGRFLSGPGIDWSLVSVAGHSQGAGYAAMIAKRHAVYRLLMISGVADVTADGAPAPWLFKPGKTPLDREYGLTNLFDPIVRFRRAKDSWHAMGLDRFGQIRSIDRQPPPYKGSHELVTTMRTGRGMEIHLSMAFDRFLPVRADGMPYYAPAWAYTALP